MYPARIRCVTRKRTRRCVLQVCANSLQTAGVMDKYRFIYPCISLSLTSPLAAGSALTTHLGACPAQTHTQTQTHQACSEGTVMHICPLKSLPSGLFASFLSNGRSPGLAAVLLGLHLTVICCCFLFFLLPPFALRIWHAAVDWSRASPAFCVREKHLRLFIFQRQM